METQTRFDLNATIANWQQELATQPDLTPEVRRELETHLRDTIEELRQRGLNSEESFWLANRRTGRPQQLDEEFAKEDPTRAWRDRLLWIIVGLLFVNFCGTFINRFGFSLNNPGPLRDRLRDFLPDWIVFYLPNWLVEVRTFYLTQLFSVFLHVIPVFLLALFLANQRIKFWHRTVNYVTGSRTRFVLAALGAFFLTNSFGAFKYGVTYMSLQLPWVLSLIALAAWLIRSNKNSAVLTM
jgi:hypothetical protein